MAFAVKVGQCVGSWYLVCITVAVYGISMMAHRGLARTGNDGLLDRVVIRPKPLHVEYTLTPLALQLVPLLKGMEGLECGIEGRGGLGRYFDELLNVPPQFGGGRPRVPPYGLFCGT
jgi:hypothetical protein